MLLVKVLRASTAYTSVTIKNGSEAHLRDDLGGLQFLTVAIR